MRNGAKSALGTMLLISVLLLAAGVALAVTPQSGAWKGGTAQNKPVSFRVVSGRNVSNFKFRVKAECPTGFTVTSIGTLPWSEKITNSRFSFSGSSGDSSIVIRGRFISKRRAKGVMRFSAANPEAPGRCYSGPVSWGAHKR